MAVSLVVAGAITLGCQQVVRPLTTHGASGDVAPAALAAAPGSTLAGTSQIDLPSRVETERAVTPTPSPRADAGPTVDQLFSQPLLVDATAAVEPAGWVRYEAPTARFTLALPATWQATQLDAGSAGASLAALDPGDPLQAQAAAEIQRMSNVPVVDRHGISFYAFNPTQRDSRGFALARFARQPLSSGIPLDVATTFLVAQIQHQPDVVGAVTREAVSLPAGAASELHYQTHLHTVDGASRTVAQTTYLVIKGQSIYTIDLSTDAARAADFAPIFEQIAHSLRLL